MSEYRIFIEEEFERDFEKMTNAEQERILKIKKQLKENPYAGKPLGYQWFREKYLNGKRLYYLIYEKYKAVLIIAISDKKSQQLTINMIKLALEYYKDEIEKNLRSTP